MAFSSWSTLKTAILDEQSGKLGTIRSYTAPNGVQITYTSATDRIKWLDYIDRQIDSATEGISQNLVDFA